MLNINWDRSGCNLIHLENEILTINIQYNFDVSKIMGSNVDLGLSGEGSLIFALSSFHIGTLPLKVVGCLIIKAEGLQYRISTSLVDTVIVMLIRYQTRKPQSFVV